MDSVPPTSSDVDQLLEQVEGELLDEMLSNLENDRLDADHARQLAGDFLAILPVKDKVELLKRLKVLSGKYAEVRDIYIKYEEEEVDQDKKIRLDKIADLIKRKDIDGAIRVAKEGNQ